MPEIVLEKIEESVMEAVPDPPEPSEPPEPVVEETLPEPILEQEEHVPEPPVLIRQNTQVPEMLEPAPKKRGRPPKAKAEAPPPAHDKVKAVPKPKPKAIRKKAPPPESDSSSSEDMNETLRNVYNHVAKPDMETAILQFLVNRKQSEQTRRRELWGRLASF